MLFKLETRNVYWLVAGHGDLDLEMARASPNLQKVHSDGCDRVFAIMGGFEAFFGSRFEPAPLARGRRVGVLSRRC